VSEVDDQPPFIVEYLRPHRNPELDRGAVGSVLVLAVPVAPAATVEAPLALEEREVAKIGVGTEDDIASVPAVAAVGPALGHVLLTPEAERAVTTAAASHLDAGAIVKHGFL